MKIETPEGVESNNFGAVDEQKASISEESKAFLFEMMSKNIYSNPIGSIVREITSNCFDAHKEIEVDDAVIISKKSDEEGNYISFKDVGVGLSPDRIKNIYMNYFSSSKRGSNDLIGGFGLGSKTPLSYANHFYITTIYNGIKYDYNLSMGTDNIPTLNLLYEEPSTERNGTEVKIHMRDWEKDLDYSMHYEDRFKSELKSQLCYFDNVYFHNWGINNDYRLYETKYFKFRNKDQYSEEMHVVLGKVCYPINWKELGIKPIQIAVGVKFDIGELQVTPNRENLRYTDQAKELIKQRIKLAYDEALTMFKEQNPPIKNYFEWYKLKQKRPHVTFTTPGNLLEDSQEDKLYLNYVEEIEKRHRLSFAEGLEFLEIEGLLSCMYTFVGTIKDHTIQTGKKSRSKYQRHNYGPFSLTPDISKNNGIYISNKVALTETTAYIIDSGSVFREVPISQFLFKKNFRDMAIKTSLERVQILEKKLKGEISYTERDEENNDISNHDRNKSVFTNRFAYFEIGIAKRFYEAIKILREQVKDYYNSIPEPTIEQIAEFKEWKLISDNTKRRKKEGKVLCKNIATNHNYSYEWNYVSNKVWNEELKKHVLESTGIEDYKGIIIYGFQKDTKALKKAVVVLSQFTQFLINEEKREGLNPRAVRILQISQQNEKFFKGKANMTHVENLYSDNKLFRKLASSLKIEEYLGNTVRDMSYGVDEYIKAINNISIEIGEHFKFLYSYWKKAYNEDVSGSEFSRKDIKKEILEIATKFNLFDPLVENRFKQIDNWFKNVEWLKFIEINESSIPIILIELRNHKKKLNIDYYQKIITEDKFTIKGIDKKQLSLELVIQEETDQPKFKVLTKLNAA